MRADFLVLLSTIGLFALGNPTTRILDEFPPQQPEPEISYPYKNTPSCNR